jgi:hypothetical protein
MFIIKGPYAATFTENDCSLSWDWSYDALDFKSGNSGWITLSLGSKCQTNDITKITPDLVSDFKRMCFEALNHYSNENSNIDIIRTREELQKIVDLFV